MTETRIGDTIHYGAGSPTRCYAAIVIEHLNDEIGIRVLDPRGADFYVIPPYDTDGTLVDADGDTHANFGGFTPGTWHHTH